MVGLGLFFLGGGVIVWGDCVITRSNFIKGLNYMFLSYPRRFLS